MFKRPTPDQIKARKLEIKRRYERKAKVSRRSRGMAAIRIAELIRWMDHTFGAGGDIEASPQAEVLARIMVHHFVCLPQGDRRASEWLQTRCPTMPARDREYLIGEATHCPLKWSADKLAWKIGLRDAVRTELKITTIGAVDVTREERAARRKARQAELQKALRARRKAARVNTI